MEIKDLVIKKEQKVNNIIDDKVNKASSVKEAIDLLTTQKALEQEDTIEVLVTQKQDELEADAKAKKTSAEKQFISEEAEKIKAQKQKQIEEYDKIISALEKEAQGLRAENDKAEAYFQMNKELFSYILIKEKKSLKVMHTLIYLAVFVFILVQLLILPITISGKIVEGFVVILGGICEKISNVALKILVSIAVIVFIGAVLFAIYYYGGGLFTPKA